MAEVRNHSSQALPYGALLTKVFNHFSVKFSRELNEYIDKGFFMHMIKRSISINSTEGEKEGQEESNHHAMETKGYFEEVPPQIKEIHEDLSAQDFQLQWQE